MIREIDVSQPDGGAGYDPNPANLPETAKFNPLVITKKASSRKISSEAFDEAKNVGNSTRMAAYAKDKASIIPTM